MLDPAGPKPFSLIILPFPDHLSRSWTAGNEIQSEEPRKGGKSQHYSSSEIKKTCPKALCAGILKMPSSGFIWHSYFVRIGASASTLELKLYVFD
jgi:hypothetical protein